jgi:uncharacterized lipoprotein NlpE involved in copper resistance
MTRIIMLLSFSLVLTACESKLLKSNPSKVQQNAMNHTSKNSVDWAGVYEGVLPCADCEGISMRVSISENMQYAVKTNYLGKEKSETFEKIGNFKWQSDGFRIQLDGMQNQPSQFWVAEGKLIQLDMAGNRITGALAEKYVLKKIN